VCIEFEMLDFYMKAVEHVFIGQSSLYSLRSPFLSYILDLESKPELLSHSDANRRDSHATYFRGSSGP
jgi:hypothetical protein